jgi:crotonobetainyl-CoA:carnitine CoA-transferase CaiB-like acyl-CoA transferase
MKAFFKDLVVLELAGVLAGPIAGMFFAELGAKVIKVENPLVGGDVTRNWRLNSPNDQGELSAYYASCNYKKEVQFIDLKTDIGKQKIRALVEEADIVISNFNEQVSSKLGVDYSTLKKIKEDIIYAQLYAFDKNDPRPGYDLVMQAQTGFMYMNGYADQNPAKMPVALIDIMAAHQIKEALLLGIIQKMKTGKGCKFDISLYQSAISALANQASNYLMAGHIPQRMGTLHPNIAPYGDLFQTKDKATILLAVGSDPQFKKLGKTLNFNPLMYNTFETNAMRLAQREILKHQIQEYISPLSYQELSQSLHENGIPFCKIMSLEEVFEHPLAKEMVLEEILNSGQKTKCVSTLAFNISE